MTDIQKCREAYTDYTKVFVNAYKPEFWQYPDARIRFEYVRDRLKELKLKSVLDVGCGAGAPLLELLNLGIDAEGIDITPSMITEAKKLLSENKQDIERARIGNIDFISDVHQYDSIINLGAIPHVENQETELRKYNERLKQGGKIFIEMRNELFAFFTFNKYTYDLFKKLMPNMPQDVDKFLKEHLVLNEPDHSGPYWQSEPKFNNPLIAYELYEKCGFKIDKIIFFHYHYIPPIFEKTHPEFNSESLKIEEFDNWEGMFKASAFLVEATKI